MRHFLNMFATTSEELRELIDAAARLKELRAAGEVRSTLAGKVIGLVFEKPSLRTRVSFESGVAQLGGTTLFLPGNEIGLGWRETHADFARTMSRFVDALVLRVFRHETVDAIAESGSIPIVNGLSDRSHPCQALADLMTIQERFGTLERRTVAFIGDGNNVARSLAVGCMKLGVRFLLAAPRGYEFDEEFIKRCVRECSYAPELTVDPVRAVEEADIIATDVWTSMGQEAERDERLHRFAPYQVNEKLLGKAPSHCRVLHCLPAHRGEEITSEVLDGPQSAVFDQAENRLHVQKAVLEKLFQR